jgi:hypothetical protein
MLTISHGAGWWIFMAPVQPACFVDFKTALARTPSARVGWTAPSVRESFWSLDPLSPFHLFCLRWWFPMDTVWLERLTDERPGLSFLTEYCRAIRLLSGICNLGCIRARRRALDGCLDAQFGTHILSEPQVRSFLNFIGEFSAGEPPVVFEVIRQHLFPDAPSRCLFRAAGLDPRAFPYECRRDGSQGNGTVDWFTACP